MNMHVKINILRYQKIHRNTKLQKIHRPHKHPQIYRHILTYTVRHTKIKMSTWRDMSLPRQTYTCTEMQKRFNEG